MEDFVKLENVTKVYKMGEVEIRAVDGIDFSISKGEFVVIVVIGSGYREDDSAEYFGRHGHCLRRKSSGRRKRRGTVQAKAAYRISEG